RFPQRICSTVAKQDDDLVALGGIALAVSSAALYSLGFPPFSWAPLVWISLVPLFVVAARARTRVAALCGLVWGVTLAFGTGWPLPQMLASYVGLPRAVGWIVLLAIGVGLTGTYVAAFCAWLSFMARRRAAGPLLVGAAWGVCEFARSRLLIGNPWALAAYSQIRFLGLSQIADATGPYGVGVLVAAVNASLAASIVPGLRGRRPALALAGVGLAFAGGRAYGEGRLGEEGSWSASREPVKVAVVQGAIARPLRSAAARSRENLDLYLGLTRQVAATSAEIVFWPEHALDFYLQESSPE